MPIYFQPLSVSVLPIPDGPTGDPVKPEIARGWVGNSLFIKLPSWFHPVTPVVEACTIIGEFVSPNPTCHFVCAEPSLYVAISKVFAPDCKSVSDVFHSEEVDVYRLEVQTGAVVDTIWSGQSAFSATPDLVTFVVTLYCVEVFKLENVPVKGLVNVVNDLES